MVLDDFHTPRVQAHAGAALVNFCEQCPKSILLDYLGVIVAKLENVFRVKLEEVSWGSGVWSGCKTKTGVCVCTLGILLLSYSVSIFALLCSL